MALVDRLAIARALSETADLLALTGREPFRARAYDRGAQVLEQLSDGDFGRILAEGRLTTLAGIGRGLAAVIADLAAGGRSETLDGIRKALPAGAGDLARIPNLGLRKIQALHAALGIETVEALRRACETGRVRGVKGFGEKTERRILESIRALDASAEPRSLARVLLPQALEVAERVLAHLRSVPGVTAVEVAGDLRRHTETIDRLVVVLASRRPEAALDRALASPLLVSRGAREGLTARATLVTGLPLELRVTAPERWAAALLAATGSDAHRQALEPLARQRGVDLDDAVGEDEAQLYRRLGLPYIPPEMREGAGEVEAARAGALPADLVALDDVRGLVHCHTDYSDGRHTIAQMAQAAQGRGVAYLTITDHSPTAFYANGLSVDRLRAQWDEIARVQESVSVRLLRGTESDILADGALDYPDAILEQLDVIIASVHARHRMDADRMTERIIRAMRHPCFKVWGHALGRLIPSRPPIEARVEEILDVIAESRAAIEINGDPHRLDLEPRWVRAARLRGIPFVISTDAHATGELDNVRYGVAMARRGWVRRGEVLNTRDVDAFTRAVAPVERKSRVRRHPVAR
ncbi:MAG TPA: PHP domain-containing protein [Methylomirabilota bacterium]